MKTDGPYSYFTSQFRVRPDDIDMFNHVHSSTYIDYVLAARYEQMETCYKMPMEDFLKTGNGWVVKSVFMDYKRPLGLGDTFTVKTGIENMHATGCKVNFEIRILKTNKIACDGWFEYVMIDIKSGRAVKIPEDVIEKCNV